MTLAGLQQVAVIEDCSCLQKPQHCQRLQHNVIHFPGTPFETVVDIGKCSGNCTEGKFLINSNFCFRRLQSII